jgi:hypothetical protein
MSKLDYKIEERYTSELADIASRLDKLRNGRVYELSNVQSDGFIATNVDKLKDQVNKLLGKIQNDGQANDEIFL